MGSNSNAMDEYKQRRRPKIRTVPSNSSRLALTALSSSTWKGKESRGVVNQRSFFGLGDCRFTQESHHGHTNQTSWELLHQKSISTMKTYLFILILASVSLLVTCDIIESTVSPATRRLCYVFPSLHQFSSHLSVDSLLESNSPCSLSIA